jgi:hypothetical protein
MSSESAEPLIGRLGAQLVYTAKAARISRSAAKSGGAGEWDGWGQVSDDGKGQYNPSRSEGPWGKAARPLERWCIGAPCSSAQNEVITRQRGTRRMVANYFSR